MDASSYTIKTDRLEDEVIEEHNKLVECSDAIIQ